MAAPDRDRPTRLTLDDIAREPGLATFQPGFRDFSGTLRPLVHEDVDALRSFYDGLSPRTRAFFDIPAQPEALAREHCAAIARFDKLRLVLDVDGEISGIFEFSLDLVPHDVERYSARGVELNQGTDIRYGLCVADRFQGRGVASAVQPFVRTVAESLGAERVILWGGVLIENPAAIGFYRKHGFVEVGPFVADDGQACLDMILDLKAAV